MFDRLRFLNYTTILTLAAMAIVMVNPWLALLIGFIVAVRQLSTTKVELTLPKWTLWVPGIVMVGLWLAIAPMPYDDLNRHVTAWKINFDYRGQYPLAEMPAQDMWLGFDWLMYQIQDIFNLSPRQVAKYWPLGMAVSAYCLFVAAIRKVANQHATAVQLLVITICFYPIATRAWLGRPEFLYVLLLGLGYWVEKPIQKLLWALGFLLLVPTYWMAWPYAAGVLLFNQSSSDEKTHFKNAVLGVVLAICHVLFWQYYTGDYLSIMDWLKRTLQNVLPTESYSLDQSLMTTAGLVLFLWLARVLLKFEKDDFRKQAPMLVLITWLSFSNQVRFIAPLLMVAVPWLLMKTNPVPVSILNTLTILVVVAVQLTGGLGIMYAKQPTFAVPANAFVLSEDPFATVLYSTSTVRVEPSPAIGATPKLVAQGLSKGTFDCQKASTMGITHVIEHSFNSKPDCLNLLEVQKEWRYWEVKRSGTRPD